MTPKKSSGTRPNPWLRHIPQFGDCPCPGQRVELQFRNGDVLVTGVPEKEDWEIIGNSPDDILYWRKAR